MDKEKKAETIAAMADSLADFVIRTARDKDAPPEAVRSLPEAAKVALDLLDYCWALSSSTSLECTAVMNCPKSSG